MLSYFVSTTQLQRPYTTQLRNLVIISRVWLNYRVYKDEYSLRPLD